MLDALSGYLLIGFESTPPSSLSSSLHHRLSSRSRTGAFRALPPPPPWPAEDDRSPATDQRRPRCAPRLLRTLTSAGRRRGLADCLLGPVDSISSILSHHCSRLASYLLSAFMSHLYLEGRDRRYSLGPRLAAGKRHGWRAVTKALLARRGQHAGRSAKLCLPVLPSALPTATSHAQRPAAV